MILENGSIVEQGTRELLANDPDSNFHRLLRTGSDQILA
jgi:ABC-type multidrug transport system fused ATPase/permease subunit